MGSFWWWFLIWHLRIVCSEEGKGRGKLEEKPCLLFCSSPDWLPYPRNRVSGRQPIWKHSPQESLKFGREQMILMVFGDLCQSQSSTSHLWRHFENWWCLNIKVNNPGRIRCICGNTNAFSYVKDICGAIYLCVIGLKPFDFMVDLRGKCNMNGIA